MEVLLDCMMEDRGKPNRPLSLEKGKQPSVTFIVFNSLLLRETETITSGCGTKMCGQSDRQSSSITLEIEVDMVNDLPKSHQATISLWHICQ